MREVINFLKPLELVTKEMSGDKYVTCSKIIPLVSCMINKIRNLQAETATACYLKDHLLIHIDKRFKNIEKINIYAFSTILDPRFKKIHFKDQVDCSRAIQRIDNAIKTAQEKNLTGLLQVPTYSSENATNDSLWGFHKELLSTYSSPITSICMNNGLKEYLSQPNIDLEMDPLRYWSVYSTIQPELSAIAVKFLSIVGTSVSSERVLIIMNESRNRLLPKRLNKLLFLNSLDFDDWML